jgi:hypothetical protein
MTLNGEQILLRIYLRNADRAPHSPTWERIVKAARTDGLAGATVLQGILGFGSRGILKDSIWSLADNVPMIVEIVDSADRISAFMANTLTPLMQTGMATLERAAVMMYRPGKQDPLPPLQLASLLHPLSTLPKLQQSPAMTINENGVLLRIFIGESDTFEGKALHEAIVRKVRELGLAGATVLRGIEGFGAQSVVHKSRLLELSTDMPIVIEIVDTEDKVRLLLPHLEKMVGEGMITMEYVAILMYRHRDEGSQPAQ